MQLAAYCSHFGIGSGGLEARSFVGSQILTSAKALRNMVFPFTRVFEEVEDVDESSEELSE